jgi:hypothetical protein
MGMVVVVVAGTVVVVVTGTVVVVVGFGTVVVVRWGVVGMVVMHPTARLLLSRCIKSPRDARMSTPRKTAATASRGQRVPIAYS